MAILERMRNLVLVTAASVCLTSWTQPEYAVFVAGGWGLLNVPDEPKASLILIPGGDGEMHIEPNGTFQRLAGNQLVRTRRTYGAHSIATLTVDKPVDVAKVVAYMRRVASPVAVVATSRGSLRVPQALDGRPDAVVVTSAFLDEVRQAVMNPARLPPTLVVHHRGDACWFTPKSAVAPFKAWGGRKVSVAWLDGGINEGDPCQAFSVHGFNGLDADVVNLVAKFVLNLKPASAR
ncbi:MAG: hypothetical protein RLZ98_1509 [Pseudomonadota bacterium]